MMSIYSNYLVVRKDIPNNTKELEKRVRELTQMQNEVNNLITTKNYINLSMQIDILCEELILRGGV